MAKQPKPGDELAVVSVDRERARIIELLSQHFAQDNLSIDELEQRIESAYRAASVPALREIIRDLTPHATANVARPAASPSADLAPERERIAAIMSTTTRRGAWRPARRIDVLSVMAETELDLTQALLPAGVTEIHFRALMTSVRVIVPAGVRVVLQATTIMGTVSDETLDPPAVGSGAPVVRITGFIVMGELRALLRREDEEL